MTKIILSFVIGFIIGLAIVWGWNAYTDISPREVEAQENSPNIEVEGTESVSEDDVDSVISEEVTSATESTRVRVEDQTAGPSVRVSMATLEADGWIVVHEEKDGLITNALGAKRRDADTHIDVHVPLLRETVSGNRYWVVLYSDDGDHLFNLETDFPIRDSANAPVTSSFQAL